MKATGTNTDISTSVIAMMGAVISPMALRAASFGLRFGSSSILASTASTTTMASSTTIPMASTRASRETVLAEKPIAIITAKVPISETGTAISGMMVARTEPRNRNTTMTTSTKASSRVFTTSWMLSSTNLVVS